MKLGEKIYNLRVSKELSQGDLAEMLGVSRQSISKWENNSAMPDIEKIIKLSDIFGVTIDELVKGENDYSDIHTKKQEALPKVEYVQQIQAKPLAGRKIAGTILLCMAFVVVLFCTLLGDLMSGLVLCIPFLVCGIICFSFQTNVGLWCAWAIYLLTDVYMRWGTSVNRSLVLMTFRWEAHMNYMRLIIAWVLVLITAVMFAVTVIRFKDRPLKVDRTATTKLAVGWGALIAARIVRALVLSSSIYRQWLVNNLQRASGAYLVVGAIISNVMLIWFLVMFIYSWRYIKGRKNCVS